MLARLSVFSITSRFFGNRSTCTLSSLIVALAVSSALCGCQKSTLAAPADHTRASASSHGSALPPPPVVASPAGSAPVLPGSPLSRLTPPIRSGPRTICPLTIEPGVAFGPVALGETLEDLKGAGLTVNSISEHNAEITMKGTGSRGVDATLKVSLCSGKIIDVWMEDLRLAPACVLYAGKAVAPTISREDLEKALGNCEDTNHRIGGSFERCHDGGVYVGHGMGNFIQIRVRPKTFPFDDACAIGSDDGSPIVLSPQDRRSLLRSILNIRELSPYWHVDRPGRDPLRIVKTPLVEEQSLTMFGSAVVWIDQTDAKTGTAYLVISKLEATKTKATVAFAYPIEGVSGTATFRRAAGDETWRLETSSVHER